MTAPAEKKKRGLPEDPAQWTVDSDSVLFRKFRRLFALVPLRALRRMTPYLLELLQQAERDAGERAEAEAKARYQTGTDARGPYGAHDSALKGWAEQNVPSPSPVEAVRSSLEVRGR